MKRFNLHILLLISAAAILIAITVSVVIAYMFKQSTEITNEFVPANVSCKVNEQFDANLKTSVAVLNTSNIEAYIRLRVVTYWEDSKGNIVARSSPDIKFGSEWFYNTAGWIYDEDNQTFYHKTPVASLATTQELLSLQDSFTGIKLDPVTEKDAWGIEYTYHPVLVFIAEAIQSKPNDINGAVSKWNVTLDANGNITQVNS